MIANRELALDDYIAMARRRLKFILLPPLPFALLAFLISFAFSPKYTSHSLLLVEPQIVPAGYVKPIITERVSDRMTTLAQNVLSRARLQPMVARLGLARGGKSEDAVIESIRASVKIVEADPNAPLSDSSKGFPLHSRSERPGIDDVTGFYVIYTSDNPRDAQQVCAEITSLLLEQNLEERQQAAQSTTEFISKQLDQAKQNLDALDQKLSEFQKLHLGQLPGDEDRNLKILAGLTAQLDANTQGQNHAEQDKAYTESVLAQHLNALDSYRAAPNLPPLRQKLVTLQNQLIELRSRYTEDFPEVIKVEKDIAQIKAQLKKSGADPDSDEDVAADDPVRMDPPEILRLKEQIHRDTVIIERAGQEQKRLQQMIDTYNARLSLSPDIEEQYKQLTRDNRSAHEIYENLLTNKSSAEMQTEMERRQQGEQVKLLDPASLPTEPSFPVRWKFALGGLAAGLALGASLALWKELQDKAIRNEGDVMAALELPVLTEVPWLGPEEEKSKFIGRIRRSNGGGIKTAV